MKYLYLILLLLSVSCITTHYSNSDFPSALARVKHKTTDTLPIHLDEEHDMRQWRRGVHIDCKHPK